MAEQEEFIEIVTEAAAGAAPDQQAGEAAAAAGQAVKSEEELAAGTADEQQPLAEGGAKPSAESSSEQQLSVKAEPQAEDPGSQGQPEAPADARVDAGSGDGVATEDGAGGEQAQRTQADAAAPAAGAAGPVAEPAAAPPAGEEGQAGQAAGLVKQEPEPGADGQPATAPEPAAAAGEAAAAEPAAGHAARPAARAAPALTHPTPAQRNLQALHDELLAFAAEVRACASRVVLDAARRLHKHGFSGALFRGAAAGAQRVRGGLHAALRCTVPAALLGRLARLPAPSPKPFSRPALHAVRPCPTPPPPPPPPLQAQPTPSERKRREAAIEAVKAACAAGAPAQPAPPAVLCLSRTDLGLHPVPGWGQHAACPRWKCSRWQTCHAGMPACLRYPSAMTLPLPAINNRKQTAHPLPRPRSPSRSLP